MRRQIDNDVLQMALLGYQTRHEEVIRKMAEIELVLRGRNAPASGAERGTTAVAGKPKRTLSAAGRRAIREGVKKRWAEFHAKAGSVQTTKKAPSKAKRVMSPSAKAKLTANLALARAARARKRALSQPA